MKHFIVFLLGISAVLAGCNSAPAGNESSLIPAGGEISGAEISDSETGLPPEPRPPGPEASLPVTSFGEIWAYLVSGREDALNPAFPVTDLCYFGADVDSYGKLIDVPDFKNLSGFGGRKHFTAICSGRALTHFVLIKDSPERKALIRDLLEAARPYDGLQIDFEYVPPRDGAAFISFLEELRAGLGGKIFTIALPARSRQLNNDVYDYLGIKPLVDRILVMAYDEHWSTSEPGPIASMGWCERVAKYSLETIGAEKLVMGLPFYGRSWGSVATNKAYVYSGIEEIKRERNIETVSREDGIPTFSFETPVSVTVYYEDDYSLSARLEMYKRMGVNSVGFWRLGQEIPGFWAVIAPEADTSSP